MGKKGIKTAAFVKHQSSCGVWTWGFVFLYALKYQLLPSQLFTVLCAVIIKLKMLIRLNFSSSSLQA